MPDTTTGHVPRPGAVARATPFRKRPLAVAMVLACAALAPPSPAEIVEFTGNGRVYRASWFDGTSTQSHEFTYYLDWEGYCNAHPGAQCSSYDYWGVAGNWNLGRPPNLTDEARIPQGAVVTVDSDNSYYWGAIPGWAGAGTLQADGQVRVGTGGILAANVGYVSDLALLGGYVETQGLLQVGTLSRADGSFRGSGITRILAVSGTFDPFIRAGHTVEFIGNFGGPFGTTGPRLEAGSGPVWNPSPGGRFVNTGILTDAVFSLQGTANVHTLPRLVNNGTLQGSLWPGDVAVDNAGDANVVAGAGMSFGPSGTHAGHFQGAAGSVLTFGGPWGHTLQNTSSLHSDGKVVFQRGVHVVEGLYDAYETELVGGGFNAYLDFKGNSAQLGRLRVDAASGELRFLTASPMQLDRLTLVSGDVVFNTQTKTTASSIQTLEMLGRGNVVADSPVTVLDTIAWTRGNFSGIAGVTAMGSIEIEATTAIDRGLYGRLRSPGVTRWHGGVINWGGTFENLAGAEFRILGDFSAGTGYGRLVNEGTVVKTAGSGTAVLGMSVDNLGVVRSEVGVLKLSAGGTHDGGHFYAGNYGAFIELAGDHVIQGGNVTITGRLDVTGGTLSLRSGGRFTNETGNSVTVSALDIDAAGVFTNRSLANSGVLTNQGSFVNLGVVSGTALSNSGIFHNHGELTISGAVSTTGSFLNDGVNSRAFFTGAGSSAPAIVSGQLHNEGHLQFNGADFSGTAVNTGLIDNLAGRFTMLPGGTLDNSGVFSNQGGEVLISAGAVLGGSGRYEQVGWGVTDVKGVLRADGGISIVDGVLRGGTPPGAPVAGSGTIIGNVTLGQFAQWKPGNSPGLVTVLGDVVIDGNAFLPAGAGNIEIEIDGPGQSDRIVVSGTVTLNAATVDLVFGPGFSPQDGDSFEWLSAGQVVTPNGSWTVNFNTTGLPAGWEMERFGAEGLGLRFNDLSGAQIAVSGSHRTAAGEKSFNREYAVLDELAVAGILTNRSNGALLPQALSIEAGGRLVNAGFMETRTFFNSGEMINRVGGNVNLTSAFDTNAGHMLNQGVMRVVGITNASGGELINEGSFSHTFLTNESGARVVNRGLMTSQGSLMNYGDFVVHGELRNHYFSWSDQGSIDNYSGGRFTVEAGGAVTGPGTFVQYGSGSVTEVRGTLSAGGVANQNGGRFSVAAGGTVVSAAQYEQSGGDSETVVNGTLTAANISFQGGVLSGAGTLAGPVVLGDASSPWWWAAPTVRPGNSPGTLTIDGDLTANAANFDIEIDGPTAYDRLVVTGNAVFGAGVTVNFILRTTDGVTGYRPVAGDSFDWLSVGGTVQGLGDMKWNLNVVGNGWYTTLASNQGKLDWYEPDVAFDGNSLVFSAAPVPEPGTWALMLVGAMVLVRQRRRVGGLVGR